MPLTSHKSHVGIYEDFNYPMCTEEEEEFNRRVFAMWDLNRVELVLFCANSSDHSPS